MQIEDGRDRPPYAVVWHDALTCPEVLALPALALRLWLLLTCYVGQNGWALGQQRMADELGASLSGVQKNIRILRDAGLIEAVQTTTPDGGPGWNSYRLLRPPSLRPMVLRLEGGVPPKSEGPPLPDGRDPPSHLGGHTQLKDLSSIPPPPGPPPSDEPSSKPEELMRELVGVLPVAEQRQLCELVQQGREGWIDEDTVRMLFRRMKDAGRYYNGSKRAKTYVRPLKKVLQTWAPADEPLPGDEQEEGDCPHPEWWDFEEGAEVRYTCTECGWMLAPGEIPEPLQQTG